MLYHAPANLSKFSSYPLPNFHLKQLVHNKGFFGSQLCPRIRCLRIRCVSIRCSRIYCPKIYCSRIDGPGLDVSGLSVQGLGVPVLDILELFAGLWVGQILFNKKTFMGQGQGHLLYYVIDIDRKGLHLIQTSQRKSRSKRGIT